MPDIVKTKEVILFNNEASTGVQSVTLDMQDETEPWVIVSHAGDELSMSVANWNSLVALFEEAKNEVVVIQN